MSANTPTTILSLDTAAQKYAYENFGVPKDWQFAPSITQNTMSENIQEAYKEGYHSRDEEVAELVKHIQRMWHSTSWNGSNYEGIRKDTTTLLNKYQNKQP